MTCREIIAQIEKDYPTSCALEWDNVGLLTGRMDQDVKRVYIGLDATDSVIREAADKGADLLLTHHPLLFHGINRVTDQDFLGNRVLNLIRSDISYYAMHTNYDVVRMAQLAAARLGWKGARPLEPAGNEAEDQGLGQIADLEQEMTLEYAVNELERGAGSQFDPELVPVFIQEIQSGRVEQVYSNGDGAQK